LPIAEDLIHVLEELAMSSMDQSKD
jgi:hypothetical protein